ncbi:uncharacterized protein LOC117818035 [Notolabrus celidotus]|uniref:uncharacterized protein LOC117818035 n=1 Tax=Notolabrus celidotus TaxID=1203425 RepID=UPI00148F58D6|nr:uncharacterized protein LOC117818035 [Notolabrus celidotus]
MPLRFLRRDNVKMILLWVMLLVLHKGYTLVPVTTVQLGEPATFTCVLPKSEISHRELSLYKQRAGDTLKLVVTVRKSMKPQFSPEFSESRLEVKWDDSFTNLTIMRTIQEDEGMYHCAVREWMMKTEWSGTYLLLEENTQRTSNLTVDQSPTVPDPVRPGDSMTLQCSVVSDSENKTCPGGLGVYWFRAGLDKSHPDIIYTDEDRHDDCDQRSEAQKSCVYRFTKNVSSSDAGTYYCAVATCGQILFGDGTKVEIDGNFPLKADVIIILLGAVLALSLIVMAFLICAINKKDNDCCKGSRVLQNNCSGWKSQLVRNLKREEIYSAAIFTMMNSERGAVRGANAAEKERIYAAVRAFGLDE